MTNSVNETEKFSGKKAVSATLAGVLAVGMVPAAAFAADADQPEQGGIELQDVTAAATAFTNGAVSITASNTTLSAGTKANTFNATTPTKAIELTSVTVTPKGQATPITAEPAGTEDAQVTYAVTKDGAAVDKIYAPGTYTITITAADGDYKGGEVSATITVATGKLSGASLYEVNEKDADDVSDTAYTYSGNAFKFGVALSGTALKEGTDYTLAIYKKGSDAVTGTPLAEVVDAGTYYAIVTGQGQYAGETQVISDIVVAPLDLSNCTITVNDRTGKEAMPTQPDKVVTGENKELVDLSKVKLTMTVGPEGENAAWNKNGGYTFTAAPAANDPNIMGSKSVTCKKVQEIAVANYDKAALAESYKVVKTDLKNTAFDASKITVTSADGKTTLPSSLYTVKITAKGNSADVSSNFTSSAAPAAGTYTLTITVNSADSSDDPQVAAYTYGGTFTSTITVYEDTLTSDADVIVKHNGKVITSYEQNYVVGMSLTQAADFPVAVYKHGTTTAVDVADYQVKLVDADGKDVATIDKAGTYTLKVSSDKYELGDNATVTITINQLDLTTAKLGADVYSDESTDDFAFVDKTATGDAVIAKALYDTKITKNASTTDDNVKGTTLDYVSTLSSQVTATIEKQNDKGEWEQVKDTTAQLGKEGSYRVKLAVAKSNAANYVLSDADNNASYIEFTVYDQNKFKFIDVKKSDWFFEAVYDANTQGYMNGYGDTKFFGPNDKLTRAEAAQVIYNMAGGSYSNYGDTDQFDDVDQAAWYATAIKWAAAAGIVQGYGDGDFGPNDPVTREQFALMLQRYAKIKGDDVDASGDLSKYQDAKSIDSWAEDAMAWAVAGEIMGVNTDILNPTGNIVRSEAAAMAVRYQPKSL